MENIFKERLIEARIAKNISQKQLAHLCKVQQSCISKWERGRSYPDLEGLILLTQLLDVSSDYLLGINDY